MASQRAIAGTLNMRVDGVLYKLQGGWKVNPHRIKRTTKEGQSGPIGFTETYVTPYFKGELSDYGGLSVQQLQNITNSSLTLELVNGKTYTLSGAYWGDDSELDTETGKIPVAFYGLNCIEVVSP